MKKLMIITMGLFASVAAHAVPDKTDDVIKAVAVSSDLAGALAATPGFKSMKIEVVWKGDDLPEGTERYCQNYSRSATFVKVTLEMMTLPTASYRTYWFSTPGVAANVRICRGND